MKLVFHKRYFIICTMQQKELRINSGKSITTPQLIISLIVWVYIIYRAVLFEITQDEAYSYFLVKTNYWKALPGTYKWETVCK